MELTSTHNRLGWAERYKDKRAWLPSGVSGLTLVLSWLYISVTILHRTLVAIYYLGFPKYPKEILRFAIHEQVKSKDR